MTQSYEVCYKSSLHFWEIISSRFISFVFKANLLINAHQVAEEMKKKTLAGSSEDSAQPMASKNICKVVDLDEARRDAIRNMPHEPEEEAQIQSILNNQQLINALADEKFMQALRSCEQSSSDLRALAQDADFGPKLRLLLDNKMIQLQ